jgi:CdiI immunity protein
MTNGHQETKGLEPLFGGYFHQDWDLEGGTPAEVIERFVTENPRGVVRGVRDEVRRLLAQGLSESETERILADAGLAYHPPSGGMTYSAFLAFVLQQLEGRADAADRS